MSERYTFDRDKTDLKNLNKLRDHLNDVFSNKSWISDSKIYRDLPNLYLNAVDSIKGLDHQVAELTAKLAEMDEIRTAFCSIFELCGLKK